VLVMPGDPWWLGERAVDDPKTKGRDGKKLVGKLEWEKVRKRKGRELKRSSRDISEKGGGTTGRELSLGKKTPE